MSLRCVLSLNAFDPLPNGGIAHIMHSLGGTLERQPCVSVTCVMLSPGCPTSPPLAYRCCRHIFTTLLWLKRVYLGCLESSSVCRGREAREGGIAEPQRSQVPHTEAWDLSYRARDLGRQLSTPEGFRSVKMRLVRPGMGSPSVL